MELNVVSDEGDVLKVEAIGRIVPGDMKPEADPIGDLLGPRGYCRKVLLSLAKTGFIDSGGLAWLVVCHKRFCQAGGKLVLHSAGPAILELLGLMRLDQAFNLALDEAAALELVGGGRS